MRSFHGQITKSIITSLIYLALFCTGGTSGLTPPPAQAGGNFTHPDFAKSLLDSANIAIGGLVFKNGNSLDKYSGIGLSQGDFSFEDQSEIWSHSLNTMLLNLNRKIDFQPYYRIQGQTPSDLRQQTHATIASYSTLKPKILSAWAEALPQTDFLVLAGIARSWVNRPEKKGKTWSRVVWVTVEIYDLKEHYQAFQYTNKIRVHATSLNESKAATTCQINPKSGVMEVSNHAGPSVPTIQQALTASLVKIAKKLRISTFLEVGSPANEDDFGF